jgi:hypothetical protein
MQHRISLALLACAILGLVGCKPTSLDPEIRDRLVGMWTDDHGTMLWFKADGTYDGRISNGPRMKGEYFATRGKLRLKELEGEGDFGKYATERTMPFQMKIDTFELTWMGKPWVLRRMSDEEIRR